MGSLRLPTFSIFARWCPGCPGRALGVPGEASSTAFSPSASPLAHRPSSSGTSLRSSRISASSSAATAPRGMSAYMQGMSAYMHRYPKHADLARSACHAETPARTRPGNSSAAGNAPGQLLSGISSRLVRSRPITVSFSASATRSGPGPLLELARSGTLTVGGRPGGRPWPR
jgi:hypothetical protein